MEKFFGQLNPFTTVNFIFYHSTKDPIIPHLISWMTYISEEFIVLRWRGGGSSKEG